MFESKINVLSKVSPVTFAKFIANGPAKADKINSMNAGAVGGSATF